MKTIHLDLSSNSYDIVISDGLLSHLSFYIKEVYTKRNIFIVTDNNVCNYYLKKVTDELKNDYNVKHVIVPAGESSKSVEMYQYVISQLFGQGIRRGDLLLALGGGVIGDLTGFVSATIFRGTPYISIPTSLLSMMDSSIGGKTGIDFMERKNIIGCFNQPRLVLIDPETLDTLPKAEYSNGAAELIKHGVIYDKDLFNVLQNTTKVDEEIIYKSLKVKEHFVINDVYDTGIRMVLNFGHTFGHIVEVKEGYRHGEAVGIGMLMALDYGIDLGLSKKEDRDSIEKVLLYWGLPINKYDYKKYLKMIFEDKKNISGELNFILIPEIGEYLVKVLNEEE